MIRHLIPRAQWSGWCGDALTVLPPEQRWHPECRHDSVKGGTFCFQWLGLIIEIGAGRIH
jgi:hypothetical protein